MTEQGEIYPVMLDQKSRGAPREADGPFACERQAFWAMQAHLLAIYEGKYVAVWHGQVVASDVDERVLVQRVYQKFGYPPM
jgi:hypothetical protein